MAQDYDSLTSARAAALFVSHRSFRHRPNRTEVEGAIRQAIRTHGGFGGCVSEVAAAYGERPDIAAPRMRWVRAVVEALYLPPVSTLGPQPSAHGADARANRVPVVACHPISSLLTHPTGILDRTSGSRRRLGDDG
jgi:hypothetical protein